MNLLKNLKLGEVLNNVDFGTYTQRERLLVYRDVLRTTHTLGKRCLKDVVRKTLSERQSFYGFFVDILILFAMFLFYNFHLLLK